MAPRMVQAPPDSASASSWSADAVTAIPAEVVSNAHTTSLIIEWSASALRDDEQRPEARVCESEPLCGGNYRWSSKRRKSVRPVISRLRRQSRNQ